MSLQSPSAARRLRYSAPISAAWILDRSAICIPTSAATLQGFRAWATSDEFPERLRASFINQEILLDMSPEELETHNKVKTEVTRAVTTLIQREHLGSFYSDGTLVSNKAANLSTEPDGTFVSNESIRSRRVRLIRCKHEEGHYIELAGTPDWVLEVVSNSSTRKDCELLPVSYHKAGIPEYWRMDARGATIDFQILQRRAKSYEAVAPEKGWTFSNVFGRNFRLVRRRDEVGLWQYRLKVQQAK